jgi:F420-dependent oxidoreductase-like protein
MRLRVLIEPRHGATYERILRIAKATERAGFEAFFRSDHYLGIDAADPDYLPTDSWTTLAGLARETERVLLGTLVTAATFRRPGVLAITVATVDQMSGGRVCLGIGTGWYEREHQSFGIPFPPLGERFDLLDEQLEVLKGLWTTPPGESFSFAGRHVQIEQCSNFPALVQDPHPPIIIGGSGPRRTPTLAARHAREFNGAIGAGLAERFANARRICEQLGRDPATLALSSTLPVVCGRTRAEAHARLERLGAPGRRLLAHGICGEPGEVLACLERQARAGAEIVYFHIYDIDDLEQIELLGAEVLPAASELEPSAP